jgi:cytochrome c553
MLVPGFSTVNQEDPLCYTPRHFPPLLADLVTVAVIRALGALCALACIFAAASCARRSEATPVTGADLYKACVPCHGAAGEGTPAIGAPAIASLPAWYVAAQLQAFQTGLRGKHADDTEGLRMRAMSRQMLTQAEVSAVASHVASLPRVTSAARITSVNASGAIAAFLVCATCHGANFEGNAVIKAPPLAGRDDWYIAAQIRKFRAGIRGSAHGDAFGPLMQVNTRALAAENVDRVAAYVHALSR